MTLQFNGLVGENIRARPSFIFSKLGLLSFDVILNLFKRKINISVPGIINNTKREGNTFREESRG